MLGGTTPITRIVAGVVRALPEAACNTDLRLLE